MTPRTYRLERRLDLAHKLVWSAAQAADEIGDFETYDDLCGMLTVLETMQRACIQRGGHLRTRPRDRAYLSSLPRDDGSPPT